MPKPTAPIDPGKQTAKPGEKTEFTEQHDFKAEDTELKYGTVIAGIIYLEECVLISNFYVIQDNKSNNQSISKLESILIGL